MLKFYYIKNSPINQKKKRKKNHPSKILRAYLVQVFKNWKLLFKNFCGNICNWKNLWKCIKCCLKTEKGCLKTQTKYLLTDFLEWERRSEGHVTHSGELHGYLRQLNLAQPALKGCTSPSSIPTICISSFQISPSLSQQK